MHKLNNLLTKIKIYINFVNINSNSSQQHHNRSNTDLLKFSEISIYNAFKHEFKTHINTENDFPHFVAFTRYCFILNLF